MLGGILFAVLPATLGVWLVRKLLRWSDVEKLGLSISLGVPTGLGLVSFVSFLGYLGGLPLDRSRWFDLGLTAAAVLLVARAAMRARGNVPSSSGSTIPGSGCAAVGRGAHRVILLGVGLSGATTLAGMVARALRSPHGEWDAWAIWNLHARFIFRDPEHPLRYVDENVAWSHPDYPLLLPLIVVRGWIINGGESPVVPMLVGPLYLLASAGLLYFGVAALQGRATARLALLALLSAPFAAAIATGQLADIPLACNELLCVVCCLLAIGLRESRYLVIAGFAGSLAAWTKNEGLFLPGALVVPCILPLLRGAFDIALRRALWLGLGLLPGMGTLLLFWQRVGGYSSGARAGTDWNRTLSQLRTPARYWTVAGRFLLEPLAVAKWGPAPLIAAAYPLALGVNGNGLIRRAAMVCGGVLALLVAMDFMTFMVITEDLKWFLDGSLDRLLLHSFPAVLAVLFALGRPLATADPARD